MILFRGFYDILSQFTLFTGNLKYYPDNKFPVQDFIVSTPLQNIQILEYLSKIPKVWKRLEGQDGGANVNKNFYQRYNNELQRTLYSNRCEISHKCRKIFNVPK